MRSRALAIAQCPCQANQLPLPVRPGLLVHRSQLRSHGVEFDGAGCCDGFHAFTLGEQHGQFGFGAGQAVEVFQTAADAGGEVVHGGEAEQREVGLADDRGGGCEPSVVAGGDERFGCRTLTEAGADQFLQSASRGGHRLRSGVFVEQGQPGGAGVFVGGGVGPGDDEAGADDGQRDVDLGGDVAVAAGVGRAGSQAFRCWRCVADAPVVDKAVKFFALPDGEWLRAMKALEADDVERTVRLAPLGGDDVVDTVWAQVVVTELRPRQIGRVPGGIDDDGATSRALVE